MQNKVKKLLELCGGQFYVERKGGSKTKGYAVIEPLRYKNKMYVEMQPTELGKTNDGCYKYLGPYDVDFSAGDTIKYMGKDYVVQRVETVCFGKNPIYNWAVLRPFFTGGMMYD